MGQTVVVKGNLDTPSEPKNMPSRMKASKVGTPNLLESLLHSTQARMTRAERSSRWVISSPFSTERGREKQTILLF